MREQHHRQSAEAHVRHHRQIDQTRLGHVAHIEGQHTKTDEDQRHPEASAFAQQQVGNDRDGLNPGKDRKRALRQQQGNYHDAEKRHKKSQGPGFEMRRSINKAQHESGEGGVDQLQRRQQIKLALDVDQGKAGTRDQGHPQQRPQHPPPMLQVALETVSHARSPLEHHSQRTTPGSGSSFNPCLPDMVSKIPEFSRKNPKHIP